jgi:hypothetical protein
MSGKSSLNTEMFFNYKKILVGKILIKKDLEIVNLK